MFSIPKVERCQKQMQKVKIGSSVKKSTVRVKGSTDDVAENINGLVNFVPWQNTWQDDLAE